MATISWVNASERERLLQYVQPGLLGLVDGSLSTLAPIFAAAFVAGSKAALLVGLAAALGAAISMGVSETLSDDGAITERGGGLKRGVITGLATFAGGAFHALPFIISDIQTALIVAYITVAIELFAIAWIRKQYLKVSLTRSLISVTLAGIVISIVGILVGHA